MQECIILLHGFGRTGLSIKAPILSLLELKVNIRVILPTAPVVELGKSSAAKVLRQSYYRRRNDQCMGKTASSAGKATASAMNAVASMLGDEDSQGSTNSWFEDAEFESMEDLLTGSPEGLVKSVESGSVKEAIDLVHSLVRKEIKSGIKPDKIIVGGHGTGSFVASRAALSFPDVKLGALWMLNGYIGGPDVTVAAPQRSLSVLVTHGTEDPIVPKEVTEATVERLKMLVPEGEIRFESIEGMRHWMWDQVASSECALGKVLLEYVNQ